MQRSTRIQRPGLLGGSTAAMLLDASGPQPSLNLDLASGILDSRIDFQRTTAGTFYRGQFNQNLVTQSETFSTWTQLAMTVANSAIPSPTGVGTAYGITEDGTTNQRGLIRSSSALTPSRPATATVYVKAGARNRVRVLNNAASGLAEFLLTGSGSVLSNSGLSASIDAVGNGWYRCRMTANCAASGTLYSHYINPQNAAGSNAYAGDGQIGIYVWGAQLTEGTLLTPYIPTTTAAITQGQIASSAPWNLLLRSQEFDNTTTWQNSIGGTGVNPVRTANNAVAPDGTTTADTITFNTGANTTSSDFSFVQQTPTYTTGIAHTLSFWIRGTVGGEQLTVRHLAGGAYTLVTATTSWQRITLTETANAGAAVQIGIRQSISGHGVINATATVELWGAQINEGSSALEYRSTTSSALWLPRFQNNPVTGAAEGLLIEGGATNLCLQSADLATTWTNDNTTEGANVITAPDGTVSADSLIDTATTTTHGIFQTISGQSTTATYTISAFLKKGTVRYVCLFNNLSGASQWGVCVDMDNPTQANLVTGAVGAGNSVSGATITNVGNGWYRVSVTGVSAITAHYPAIAHRSTVYSGTGSLTESYAGVVTNLTYVWGFQYEQQAFASSYIPTTTASVARGADSAVMSGTNFSSWYNQIEGTFLAEYKGVPTGSTSGFVWHADDGTNNQRLFLSNATGNPRNQVVDGGSTQCSLTYSSVLMTNDGKNAFAYAANDFAGSTNGGTVLTDAAGTIPTVDRIAIGSLRGTGSFINTAIRSIKFYPTRLPDATLQSLTT